MVVFFRSAFGLLALAPWFLQGRARLGHAPLFPAPGARFGGLAAMYCFFYALAHMRLAEATLLNYTTPLFIPLIAYLWLGRSGAAAHVGHARHRLYRGALILKPGLALFQPVALIGLASGILAAVAMASIRNLTRTESTTRIVFYFTAIATAVSAVPLAWSWTTPPIEFWGLLVAMGALASAAQLLMTRAYAQAPAAQIGPFVYTIVVFAGLLGWTLWDEVPDGFSLLGTVLVCLAGALTIRRAAAWHQIAGDAENG